MDLRLKTSLLESSIDTPKPVTRLAAVLGFTPGIWVSTAMVPMDTELNAEVEQQTAHDSIAGPEKSGALKADVKT
ncbi:MAG TPA: hypothetical protein VGC14_01565 [Rhizobium sp.]